MRKDQHASRGQRGLFEIFKTNTWIDEDCVVKTCEDGYIFTERGIYSCPKCTRSRTPSLDVAQFHLTKWSEHEMKSRKEERLRVTQDREYRLKRGKQMFKRISSIFSNGNGNGNGNGQAKEQEVVCISEDEVPF